MLPTLFHLTTPFGTLRVHAFGVMLSLSVLSGWYLVRRDARFRDESLARLFLLVTLVAVLGGRIAFLATTPASVRGVFDVLAVFDGGLVAFGALFAALGALLLVRRAERAERIPITTAAFADTLALPGVLAAVFGSLGAYLAGSDFGRPLSAAAPRWLARLGTFPRTDVRPDVVGRFHLGPPVLRQQLHTAPERLAQDAAYSLPVHPVQLYEAGLFCALALALAMYTRRAPEAGRPTLFALVGYGVVRIVTDPFRGDEERVRFGAVSLPLLTAAVLVLVSGALFVRSVLRAREASAAAA